MEVDQRRYFALGISALLQDYLAIANSKSLRLHHEAKYKAKANVSTSALSPQQQDVVSLLEQKAREGRGLMEKQVQYFVEYLDNITDMLSQVVYHEEGDKDLVTLAFRHRGEDEDISSHLSSMGMDHRLRVRCVTDSQLHVAHYSNDSRIRPDRLCIQGGDVLFIGAGIAEFKARQMVRRFTQDPCGEVSQGGAISLDRTDNYVTIPVTTASGNGVIISSEDRELFGPHEDRKEEPNVFVRIARRFIGASGTSTREQHPSSTEVVVTPLDETPQQYVSHGGQNLFLQRSPSGERLYLGTEDNFFQREPVYCLETRELDKPIEFCKRDLPSDISTQVVVDFFKHIDQGKIKQADIFTDGEFNLQKAIDKMRRIQVSICLLYTSDAADD